MEESSDLFPLEPQSRSTKAFDIGRVLIAKCTSALFCPLTRTVLIKERQESLLSSASCPLTSCSLPPGAALEVRRLTASHKDISANKSHLIVDVSAPHAREPSALENGFLDRRLLFADRAAEALGVEGSPKRLNLLFVDELEADGAVGVGSACAPAAEQEVAEDRGILAHQRYPAVVAAEAAGVPVPVEHEAVGREDRVAAADADVPPDLEPAPRAQGLALLLDEVPLGQGGAAELACCARLVEEVGAPPVEEGPHRPGDSLGAPQADPVVLAEAVVAEGDSVAALDLFVWAYDPLAEGAVEAARVVRTLQGEDNVGADDRLGASCAEGPAEGRGAVVVEGMAVNDLESVC